MPSLFRDRDNLTIWRKSVKQITDHGQTDSITRQALKVQNREIAMLTFDTSAFRWTKRNLALKGQFAPDIKYDTLWLSNFKYAYLGRIYRGLWLRCSFLAVQKNNLEPINSHNSRFIRKGRTVDRVKEMLQHFKNNSTQHPCHTFKELNWIWKAGSVTSSRAPSSCVS